MSSTVPSKSPKQTTSSGLSRLRIMLKRTTPAGGFTRSSWRRNASRNCSKVPGLSLRTVRAHSMLAPLVGVRPSLPRVVHLRHRLLRQPHGFEGFLMAEVVDRVDDLPVAQGDDHAHGRAHVDPARGAAPAHLAKKHNAVFVHVAKLLRLVVEVL